MGFLTPWFFGGLALLGVPVFVHLLRKHVTIPRPVSSLMFFERGVQSSTRHRRLRHLVLFALRFALILLLVLAFADPFIHRAATNSSQDLLVIVVDNSFSMRAADHFPVAKREALAVLNTRKPAQRAQILALGGNVEVLTSPVADQAQLTAALESIQPGDGHAGFEQLAQTIRGLAQNNRSGIQLHLFSDLQRSAIPSNFADMVLPAEVSLHLHSAGSSRALPNWTVESIAAPVQLSDPKDPQRSRVRAVIAGFNTPAANKAVSLVVNGKIAATRNIDVPANGRATIEFAPLDIGYGLNRCEVRIDGNDSLPADDTFYFSVRRADPERVLFVHSPRETRSATYFGAALKAAPQSAFILQSVAEDQTADFDPSRFAFVVLSDTTAIPSIFEHKLSQYVAKGGSVLILLGADSSRGTSIPVWGGSVLERHDYGRSSHGMNVGRVDFGHPALEDSQPSHDNGGWDDISIQLANVVPSQGTRIALQLSDGTPLLLERSIGQGRLLLFTSGFDNLTNDLPLHPVFVALVDRTARYLSGDDTLAGAMRVGSSVQLKSADPNHAASPVEVIDPTGRRPLSLTESQTTRNLRLERAGFYRMHFANGRDAVLGVNPDRLESDLQPMPDDLQKLWTGSSSSQPAPGEATTGFKVPVHALNLWWYVMLLVTLIAMAEAVVSTSYLGTQREEP